MVVGFGLGVLELAVGLGVVVELGLGVVVELGLGVVVSGVADPELDGEAVSAVLDEGLSLAESLDEADVLGEAELLVLADLAAVADELADVNRDAEELASTAADSWPAALFAALESTVLVGMSGHAAELMTE